MLQTLCHFTHNLISVAFPVATLKGSQLGPMGSRGFAARLLACSPDESSSKYTSTHRYHILAFPMGSGTLSLGTTHSSSSPQSP